MESNLIYLPSSMINKNYKYTISDGIISVITNSNCTQNYNSVYCDCYDVYLNNDYMISNIKTCNSNPSYYVTSTRFTDDFYYRKDISDILLSTFLIMLIGFGIPLLMITHFFKKGK